MDDNTRKTELARRAVACKHWRWMPGMFDSVTYLRIVCAFEADEEEPAGYLWAGDERLRTHYNISDSLPDLADPATLGCVEHGLLPAAWPGCRIFVSNDGALTITSEGGAGFVVFDVDAAAMHVHPGPALALAEALVSALEAAPGGGS